MQITDKGVIKDNPLQIREDIINKVVNNVPNFTSLPSGLDNNLIDESVILISQIQDMLVDTMNCISPAYANDFIIKQLGSAFGLEMKDRQLSKTTITFNGTPATFIPKGVKVKNVEGSQVFTTIENGIIQGNGSINLTCEGEDYYTTPAKANTLTVLVNQIVGVDSCTNANDVAESTATETIKEYRERFQLKAMANRTGTSATVQTNLLKVDGVVKRLLAVRGRQIEEESKKLAVVEVVVGGGDDYAVANAIFNSVMFPIYLYSNPSGAETQRTISINVDFNGIPTEVKFTRPKIKKLDLTITLSVQSGFISIPSEAYTILQQPLFENYINNLKVGIAPTGYSFDNLIYECFEANNYSKDIISKIDYKIEVDGSSEQLNDDRRLKTAFDEAYTLAEFTVKLVGNI